MIHLRKIPYKTNCLYKIHTRINHVSSNYNFNKENMLPTVRKKIFMPNALKQTQKNKRFNKLGIQMLPKAIYNQIFRTNQPENVSTELIEQCKNELDKHNMKLKEEDYLSNVNFKIPELLGNDIIEHFHIIGEQQAGPYRELVLDLLNGIPAVPHTWHLREGWTRYAPNCEPEPVPYPLEQAFVFDIEVCMSAGKAPTLATACSAQAWYGWVSPALINSNTKPVTTNQYSIDCLIPLESTAKDTGNKLNEFMLKPKIVIGHNVSFDRARVKEQYWLKPTATRFLDTMSLHVCISGLTSYQRAVLKSKKFIEEDDTWLPYSSLNNLADVYKLYCDKTITKQTRDLFVDGNMKDILDNFQQVMNYCSDDTLATFEISQKLFPMFLERFPHPVTLAGMLELGLAYLPVNNNWNRYINEAEQSFDDLQTEGKMLLAKRADQACQLLHDDKYKDDLWMWDEDWQVKELKLKKAKSKSASDASPKCSDVDPDDKDEVLEKLEEDFKTLWETGSLLPKNATFLAGYPNWYRKLCTKPTTRDWIPGPHLISTSMQITPKLLSLTWEGYPLHFVREKGWGFLVPFSDDIESEHKIPLKQLLEKCPVLTDKPKTSSNDINISQEVQNELMRKEYYSRVKNDKTNGIYKGSGIWTNLEIDNCCYFFKLPHKDGASNNVGNPLAKDFLNKFSENVLAGEILNAEQILTIARKLSYWRNSRDRIIEQMVVWLNKRNLPSHLQQIEYRYGCILPQVVVCGTLTRRAVEPTWMTASNAHAERIGSELRSMIQAPPGYNIVGADVDSQELWIAALLGDAYHAQMHGSTPFGWMTLSGKKSDSTDMHSVTAKAVGISRDHAKVINYARIYGAGQNFAERLLKQFNPSISDAEARSKAIKMFTLTKGKRVYRIRREYLNEFDDKAYNKWQAFEIAKVHGKKLDEMFFNAKWQGGTESAMFNRLENIANNPQPSTPFLNGRLSRSLEPKTNEDERYLPTRVNWVVQSGAVDFLHLMLVCMRWIMGDNVRFCLSFHDEIRYLVMEKYKYQTALAMHCTNLLTRSFCSYKLGMNDLPQSVAFFSSVEIDTVLRKESKQDCRTPSNPHGLENGYGILNGESLDIYQAIEKANGCLSNWYQFNKR